jgi:hypothetical protein
MPISVGAGPIAALIYNPITRLKLRDVKIARRPQGAGARIDPIRPRPADCAAQIASRGDDNWMKGRRARRKAAFSLRIGARPAFDLGPAGRT